MCHMIVFLFVRSHRVGTPYALTLASLASRVVEDGLPDLIQGYSMAARASRSRSAPRIHWLLPGVQNMEGTTITMNAHFEADKHNPGASSVSFL
jgi:hypothetical protein